MATTIRTAQDSDLDALDRLFGQIEAYHRVAEPRFFAEPTLQERRALVASWIAGSERYILVADDDEAGLVGMVVCIQRDVTGPSIIRERRVLIVDTLVVDEAHQRQGVGRLLMDAAHAYGAAHNITEFQLGVYAFNTGAIALYESMGYRTYQHRMVMSRDE